MSKAIFDEVIEEVRALPPEEQRRLRELLDHWLAEVQPQSTEDEFEQKLYEAGLLNEIKPPITDFTPDQNRRPIPFKGKPLSEIIIEERR